MESPEQVVSFYGNGGSGGGGIECATTFTKRKRTKRLRALSSPPREEDYSSSTVSTTTATTEEDEEEYMAHCLILLARGRGRDEDGDEFVNKKTTAKAGFYAYQCKTCDKCFPSFQALGGHRASHKKPKLAAAPETGRCVDVGHVGTRESHVPAGKLRVHECSICGSEFSSGQALGGHMRRHRPIGPSAGPAPESPGSGAKEERNLLALDLNLPAPSEELAFTFALVDCRY